MSGHPHVLVIGSANTDLVVRTARLPSPGETVLGGTFFTAQGGKGANQAVAAARAGAPVTFVGRIGADDFGRETLSALEGDRIGTEYVFVDPDLPTGVAFILVDEDGENTIVVASGANAALSPVQLESSAPALDRAGICLLQLESPLASVSHAVAMANERGVPAVLNPAPAQDLPPEVLEGLFLITPNESETEILTGIRPDSDAEARRAAQALVDRGVEFVVITLGDRGAFLLAQGRSARLPAPSMDATDTTAAGDAFNGALAAALCGGSSLEEAVGFANCAGALSVTRKGAQPSLPERAEIDRLNADTAP
ncbi:MAG: ribokinase [Candidatus Latescibacteria bacterium]|jgi:ribokinase|nr:ribokinase [Candidatus Latescibacterota bacterium]